MEETVGESLEIDKDELVEFLSRTRTSTYRHDSTRAIVGSSAERIVLRELRASVSNEHVVVIKNPIEENDLNDIFRNHREGDILVLDDRDISKPIRSVEVKSSLYFPNVCISDNQLSGSEASFLVCLTLAGLWACSMDEARKKCRLMNGRHGRFYIIPYDAVCRVPLSEVTSGV